MKNIRVIKTGINVSKILAQLKQYPEDWESQKTMDGQVESLLSRGYDDIPVGVLQLVVGAITEQGQDVRNSEICVPTSACGRHTEILHWAWKTFGHFSRCAFLALPPGKIVGKHIDWGTYYLNKDRYHLSIQGRYRYTVGDESVIVEPGTFLWFNNKLEHGTENIGDETRITFVIDVIHSPNNP